MGNEEESAGIDLWECFGPWAAKLGQLGFITTYTRIIDRRDYIHGELVEPMLASDMFYEAAYGDLATLVSRDNEGTHARATYAGAVEEGYLRCSPAMSLVIIPIRRSRLATTSLGLFGRWSIG